MRDQPLTTAEAASWLKCSEAEVQDHIRTGRLRPFQPGADDGRVSLNAVIVLAESLPVELHIFEVREPAARVDVPSSGTRPGYQDRSGNERSGGGYGQRPTVIVERRPTRPFSR